MKASRPKATGFDWFEAKLGHLVQQIAGEPIPANFTDYRIWNVGIYRLPLHKQMYRFVGKVSIQKMMMMMTIHFLWLQMSNTKTEADVGVRRDMFDWLIDSFVADRLTAFWSRSRFGGLNTYGFFQNTPPFCFSFFCVSRPRLSAVCLFLDFRLSLWVKITISQGGSNYSRGEILIFPPTKCKITKITICVKLF